MKKILSLILMILIAFPVVIARTPQEYVPFGTLSTENANKISEQLIKIRPKSTSSQFRRRYYRSKHGARVNPRYGRESIAEEGLQIRRKKAGVRSSISYKDLENVKSVSKSYISLAELNKINSDYATERLKNRRTLSDRRRLLRERYLEARERQFNARR